ncbi:MAG: TlyA family RNA methyltransferase [Thermoflexales bacterium]|nr:TlyA family RNA methyltransferase [Thermoflexales bacterium]
MKKLRLDTLMVERGLAPSRQQAQRLIMAGEVMIGSVRAEKPAQQLSPDVDLSVRTRPPFVSRGGIKLDAALAHFGLDVTGWTCADVGASTGGFTDCLLQRGAAKVYAIDVGYGQLDWRLRQDPRVVVKERTNARYLVALPEPVKLVVVDVSFISLEIILTSVLNWFGEGCCASEGQVIALVKPQFEAGRRQVGKGGVVRDPAIHRQVLTKIARWAVAHGLRPAGLIPSPITGPAGNVEYLLHVYRAQPAAAWLENEADSALVSMVETCLASARG